MFREEIREYVDREWQKATCGECAWAIDTITYYPMCRRFHLDIKCGNPACPAFVRRAEEER